MVFWFSYYVLLVFHVVDCNSECSFSKRNQNKQQEGSSRSRACLSQVCFYWCFSFAFADYKINSLIIRCYELSLKKSQVLCF